MPFEHDGCRSEGDAELAQAGAEHDVGAVRSRSRPTRGVGGDESDGMALLGQVPGGAAAAPIAAVVDDQHALAEAGAPPITSSTDQTLPRSTPGRLSTSAGRADSRCPPGCEPAASTTTSAPMALISSASTGVFSLTRHLQLLSWPSYQSQQIDDLAAARLLAGQAELPAELEPRLRPA